MFQLNVTIGLNAETMGLISKLLGDFQPVQAEPVSALPEVTKEIKKGRKVEKSAETKVNGTSHEEVKTDVVTTDTEVLTLEVVRAKVADKKTALGSSEKIKKLLVDEFGVDKLTDLSADSFTAFITKLENL